MRENQAVRQEIEAGVKEWMSKFKAGDVASVAALYTEDAKFLAPHAPAFVRRDAIQAFLTGDREMGVTEVELTIAEVEADDESAIEHGRYALKTGEGTAADEGDYLVYYKKVDGAWRIHRDSITTDAPVD
jgi:uncharacterized protein (TIGR02246 family)